MDKLTVVKGVALPLAADNIDTDQIMPKQFLRGIDKSGLGAGCLFNMRFTPDGAPKSDSIFHRAGFAGAPIILAGPNFGCGSSREHAVWGLQQMGVKAVVAASFGEIFYSNCFNNGLLAARVTPEEARELFGLVDGVNPVEMTVDLEACRITAGGRGFDFTIAPRHRTMLLEGLDPIESTLRDIDAVRAFAAEHEARFPWMSKLAGRTARALRSAAAPSND